jgi:hypothetical protein
MSEAKETVIVARGNLSSKEQQAIANQLGSVGLSTEILDPEVYKKIGYSIEHSRISPYSLEEIVTPEQFLVYEHLIFFRKRYAAHHNVKTATRVFNNLIFPPIHWWNGQDLEVDLSRGIRADPAKFGLEVIPREKLGFPPSPVQVSTAGYQQQTVEQAV